MDDYQALSVLSQARKQNLKRLFGATRLEFSSYAKAAAANNVISSSKAVGKKASALKQAASGTQTAGQSGGSSAVRSLAKEFIATCAGLDGIEDVIHEMGSQFVEEVVSEVIPFFGIVVSGLKSGNQWKKVVQGGLSVRNARRAKDYVQIGDPLEALRAARIIMKRQLALDTGKAAIDTTSLGLKIAGVFADFGSATTAAVGMASALGKLALALSDLGLQVTDMRAGNKRLATPETLDATVFNECPILGCYLLTCSDTSQILNFFVADIGMAGWMDRIEVLKRDLDPVLADCSRLIQHSRITLTGLKSNKGLIKKKGFMDTLKANVTNSFGRLVKSKAVAI